MGIEEAILQEVEERGEQKGHQQGLQKGLQQGELQTKVKGIQKALKQDILNNNQIADLFEVSIEFVQRVQKGEIK